MLSINMRIFKTVLLIASFGASVRCLPVGGESAEPKTTEVASPIPPTSAAPDVAAASSRPDADYYDQRQNGSENYRIHVDGVVLVFAPVEALLLAGAAGTTESSLSISDHAGTLQLNGEKPNTDLHNKTDQAASKTIQRPALRLANLLTPFLRRIRHEQSISVH